MTSSAGDSRNASVPVLGLVAAYAALTVVVPFSALTLDFGFSDGWKFARLYSHLFLYPLLFGCFMIVYHLRTVRALLAIDATKRALPLLGVLLSIGLVAGLVRELLEVPAPFEYQRAVLAAQLLEPEGFPPKSTWDYIHDPEPIPADTLQTKQASVQARRAAAYRQAFEDGLPSNSLFIQGASTTKWAYLASTIVQTIVMVSVFLSFGWSMRLYTENNRQYAQVRRALIPNLLWTTILCYPWLAMRKAFEIYQADIYRFGSQSMAIVLAILFIISALYLAAVSWKWVGERVQSIVGLVSSVGGVGLYFNEDWLTAIFPRDANVLHYLIFFVVVFTVLAMTVMPIKNAN